jgi:hypothetical protein
MSDPGRNVLLDQVEEAQRFVALVLGDDEVSEEDLRAALDRLA